MWVPQAAAFVRRARLVVVTRSAVQLTSGALSSSPPDAVPSAAPIAADAVAGSALFSMAPAASPACAGRCKASRFCASADMHSRASALAA